MGVTNLKAGSTSGWSPGGFKTEQPARGCPVSEMPTYAQRPLIGISETNGHQDSKLLVWLRLELADIERPAPLIGQSEAPHECEERPATEVRLSGNRSLDPPPKPPRKGRGTGKKRATEVRKTIAASQAFDP